MIESFRDLDHFFVKFTGTNLTGASIMAATGVTKRSNIVFRRITANTVLQICELSDTLHPEQRAMVADNSVSIAEAHFSENAWFRAIYADETPVGFIMLHIGADEDDGIDCPGMFLWRLMIAGPYQEMGFGRRAIGRLLRELSGRGVTELYTSCGLGDGSPAEFYRRLGFIPTGGSYGDEIELVLTFQR